MTGLAMSHAGAQRAGALARSRRVPRHVSVPHTIINAPISDVYQGLADTMPDTAMASEMYFTAPTVRHPYAILGSSGYVTYALYPVPGGCQVSARIDVLSSPRSILAARRAIRAVARQVRGELTPLKDELE